MQMRTLRFAIIGAGFWAQYQLAAWRELSGVECAAVCDRVRERAEALARQFGLETVYTDAAEMLRRERLDFVDIITGVETHGELVALAAQFRTPVICQKPMAGSLAEATTILQACHATETSLLIHENWRWQAPLRQVQKELCSGCVGQVFRARLQFCSSFPVFDNQPALKELDQFILTDMGSHILDTARFLFGEARTLACQTQRTRRDIQGEDVATMMMQMESGATVVCELSYASCLEHERFPETYVCVEGEQGSIELRKDFWVHVTTADGTHARRYPPPRYAWADPAYDLVQASIVPCNADLLAALRGEKVAETTGEDNLKTMQLVFACYEAARNESVIHLSKP
jgi:D-apiose dehydrogenase